jgi:hypothetical protein
MANDLRRPTFVSSFFPDNPVGAWNIQIENHGRRTRRWMAHAKPIEANLLPAVGTTRAREKEVDCSQITVPLFTSAAHFC